MSKYFTFVIIANLFFLSVLSQPSFSQKIKLEQAIEEALINNPDLIKEKQKTNATKAKIWEAVSPKDPHFFIEMEGIPDASNSFNDYEAKKIGIHQEIEFPLNYYFKTKWQYLEKKRANSDYLLLRNDIVAETKTKFFKTLLLKTQSHLHEDILRISKQLLHKARVRVLAGESSPYDSLKVMVDLAEVENHKFLIEKKYDIALSELAMVMGRESYNFPGIDGELLYSPISLTLDSLQTIAMTKHPLLLIAEINVNQNKTERNLSWSGLLPNFELKYFKQEFQGMPDNKSWGGEIGASVPLFFFLKGQGKIRAASYNVDGAKWEQISVKRKIRLKVKEAFFNLKVAESFYSNYKNNLNQVEELVRIASRSYEEGEMGYLEVAEALRSMNKTKVGYSEALFSYLKAQADLEKAVGVSLF